jgi:hypothetical protein
LFVISGSNILVPFVVLRCSNAAIQHIENRYPFTQNTPGGLFCWIDQGHRMAYSYSAKFNKSQEMEENAKGEMSKNGSWFVFEALNSLQHPLNFNKVQ